VAFAEEVNATIGSFRNQRSPEQFRVREIWAKPALERDPDWTPQFPAHPFVMQSFDLDLTDAEVEALRTLRAAGVLPPLCGDEELPVAAAMTWFQMNCVRPEGQTTQFIMDL
jgi:hypothetical protein